MLAHFAPGDDARKRTAADYTPAWAHRDNNHAWNVLLDREGRGHDAGNAHAAKVYRKSFALQRDSLAFQLPEGREAPNRFLASEFDFDVTDQYAPTTDIEVALDPAAVAGDAFAYICVFNGGEWVAIDWAPTGEDHRARFTHMGCNIVYLPPRTATASSSPPPPRSSPCATARCGTCRGRRRPRRSS